MSDENLVSQADLRAEVDQLIIKGISLSGSQPQAVRDVVAEIEACLKRPDWDEPYQAGWAGLALLQGLVEMHFLNYVTAFAHTAQAMRLYEQLDDAIGLTRAYYWRGVLHRRTYNLSQALDDMQQAQQQAQRVSNYKLTCNVINGMASIHMMFGDHLNATKLLEEAIALARQHEDEWIETMSMSNVANQYIQLGQIERGLECARRTAEYFLAHEVLVMAVWSLTNVALALRRLGQHEEALRSLHQAYELALSAGSDEKRITVLLALGEVHMELGQLALAISYYEQALALESTVADQTLIIDGYKSLAECYRASGDHERAYKTIVEYYERRLKAYNVEVESKMTLLQARMETENAQRVAQAERERAEILERLREQDRMRYQELEELRLDLLRTIAHDAKSPLSTIGLALDVLRQRFSRMECSLKADERQALERQLELIKLSNQAITRLINETMAAARQRFIQ